MNALVILVWLLDRRDTLSCDSKPNVWGKMRSQSIKRCRLPGQHHELSSEICVDYGSRTDILNP